MDKNELLEQIQNLKHEYGIGLTISHFLLMLGPREILIYHIQDSSELFKL